jgi:hypothetical protein
MPKRFETVLFRAWLGGHGKNQPKVHRVGACHGQTFSLAHASNRNPSGDLAWGDTSPGALNLARAILAEVGGQAAADAHGEAFLYAVIRWLPADQPFEMHAGLVREWLASFPGALAENVDAAFADRERHYIEAQLIPGELERLRQEAEAQRAEDERDFTAMRLAGLQGGARLE